MWTSAFRWVGTRLAFPVVAACLVCSPVWSATTAEGVQSEGQAAVWKQKELQFVYFGFTTKYSCDGLRDKVRNVLVELGANKKDLQVRATGCTSSFGRPDPFPGVRVKMSVLEPAAGASADDKQPSLQAHWKPVDLKVSDYGRNNDSGECELVEQIRSKILPLFATRNVDFRSDCIPHQLSAAGASLKFDVLAVDQKDVRKDDKTAAPN